MQLNIYVFFNISSISSFLKLYTNIYDSLIYVFFIFFIHKNVISIVLYLVHMWAEINSLVPFFYLPINLIEKFDRWICQLFWVKTLLFCVWIFFDESKASNYPKNDSPIWVYSIWNYNSKIIYIWINCQY